MSNYMINHDISVLFWQFCLPPLLNSFSWAYQRLDNPGFDPMYEDLSFEKYDE